MDTRLNLAETAERLGTDRAGVDRLVAQGLLDPFRTLGGHRRFSEVQVAQVAARLRRGRFEVHRSEGAGSRHPAAGR